MTFDNLSCSRNLVNQTSGSTCCQVCCLNTDICGIHTNIRISAQNSQKSFLRPQNRTKNNYKAGNDVNTNAFYLPKLNSEKTVNNSTPQSASRAASHRTSTFSGAKLQNVLLCLYYNLCNFADVDSFHMLICGFLQFLVNCSIFSKYEKKRIFLFHTQLLWHSGIYCDACLPSYFILFIPRWFTWSLWSQRNTQFMLGASFSSRNHRKRVLMSSLDMSLYSSIKTRFDDHWNRFQVFPGVARVSCIGRDHPH